MTFSSNDIYNNGTYKNKNPNWDDNFAPWKAAKIQKIINKNQVKFSSVIEVGCGAGGILEYLQNIIQILLAVVVMIFLMKLFI